MRLLSCGITKAKVPNYISDNLKYALFDWQRRALENLMTYEQIRQIKEDNTPMHLMFNMATGTGKTLLMAACMLYYYEKGYRKFLFFVNQNNIIDKTESNFINKFHNKYLFKENIILDGKKLKIKKVEKFSDDSEEIEIKFTTIQKLYNDIHLEKENQLLYSELMKFNIVMLADEAHHLNANTISNNEQLELDIEELTNSSKEEVIEKKGWEHTVLNLILNKNNSNDNNKNILLEFTATIPENEQVYKKYKNKIIFKFGLKEFLQRGYTKEINLISSTFDKKDRILQALLFNWYRHKIAVKNNIKNFKPVILFRSKTIDESEEDFRFFNEIIENLTSDDFDFLSKIDKKMDDSNSIYEQGKSRTQMVMEYIIMENISLNEIIEFLKYNFAKNKCIITNSESNKNKTERTTQEQEILLNSLEDSNNGIRAIFTVKRLTEGWDVLNLYDIVRLYQGQNAGGSTKKTPKATVEEKQLIGRGVRYYPFKYKDKIENKRKFDDDLQNEMRLLEELYFYTYDEDSRYISHLKNELKRDGYIQESKISKKFGIKEDFKKSKLYNDFIIWGNEKAENPNRRKIAVTEMNKSFFGEFINDKFEFSEQEVNFDSKYEDNERLKIINQDNYTLNVKIKEFEKHIFYKAINIMAEEEFFQFENLKKELEINTIDDLLKEDFLGNFEIKLIVSEKMKFSEVSNQNKLKILIEFLEKFKKEFSKTIEPYVGTSEFIPARLRDIFDVAKYKMIEVDEESDMIESQLRNDQWYILDSFYGTSEEKALIRFLRNSMKNLKERFNEVYLLRNEEIYKIYNFKNADGFQPDFILFAKDKKVKNLYYQIFIEPKGNQLMEQDNWKNEFLKEINEKYSEEPILVHGKNKYKLIGLPLFNEKNNKEFEEAYNKLLENR